MCGVESDLTKPPVYADALIRNVIPVGANQMVNPPRWFSLSSNGTVTNADGIDLGL
jgi:hypothetical protein